MKIKTDWIAMGMGMEGRRQFTEILPTLILVLYVTSWNRSVSGDNSISGVPQLPIPSIPDVSNIHLPKITIPGIPDVSNIPLPQITISGIPDVPNPDAQALLNFRAQLSDPRDALSSWNPLTDCCTWRGITCSSGRRRVTGLQLGMSTQGSESDSSFLSVVSYSSLVAGVPLSELSALEVLSLTSVTFNTNLPSTWGVLSNLHSLSLVNCKFTGTIPPTYALLTNLSHLCLSDNMLTGELPLSMTQVFSQLRTLDLSSNAFTGGIQLLFHSNLTSLDLGHNEFDDNPLPDLFLFLPSLCHLDLSQNRFGGSIPLSLQLLPHLRFLDLSANGLDGSIPSALFTIKTLTSVYLHDNQLSGLIPAIFSTDSHIEELDLSSNSLTGVIPLTISQLGELHSLDLSHNNLSGGIPGTLILNSKLEFLFLENNELFGIIPPELVSLHNLVLANVSDNFLLGPIPGGPWPLFPASAFEGNPGLCGPPLTRCFLGV